MLEWILKRWRKGQRATDLRILWPACKAQAPSLDHAKAAFAYHAFHDYAWVKDYTSEELIQLISELE